MLKLILDWWYRPRHVCLGCGKTYHAWGTPSWHFKPTVKLTKDGKVYYAAEEYCGEIRKFVNFAPQINPPYESVKC